MFDEQLYPDRKKPPMEILECDELGYVLAGNLVLEIKGQKPYVLRPGDGFYIPKGQEHRGYPTDEGPVRLITVSYPAKY
jgi:mannose-6-phosphate isomerase-like protein (cupin superfamily)